MLAFCKLNHLSFNINNASFNFFYKNAFILFLLSLFFFFTFEYLIPL